MPDFDFQFFEHKGDRDEFAQQMFDRASQCPVCKQRGDVPVSTPFPAEYADMLDPDIERPPNSSPVAFVCVGICTNSDCEHYRQFWMMTSFGEAISKEDLPQDKLDAFKEYSERMEKKAQEAKEEKEAGPPPIGKWSIDQLLETPPNPN